MKLHVLSDLHLGFSLFEPPDTGADIVVLAGDVTEDPRGPNIMAWIEDWRARWTRPPEVVLVAGNHEFYCGAVEDVEHMRHAARRAGVHFLERDEVTLGGVRILGCTLWTDFLLFGARERMNAIFAAAASMNDYAWIARRGPDGEERGFTPGDAVELFESSIGWLMERLDEPSGRSTVVVTHHAPHPHSIPADRQDDPSAASYVSDLRPYGVFGKAALWIHGHTHESFDYRVEGEQGRVTRVLCNPRGYVFDLDAGNRDFDPELVVEI